jgi:hypothetical protein
MHPATMKKLEFFRGDTVPIKPKKSKKMHIGFSDFLDKKPDRNQSVWADFGSVLGLFFSIWLYFLDKNRTEPKMITSKKSPPLSQFS